jgi:hypothetical protein
LWSVFCILFEICALIFDSSIELLYIVLLLLWFIDAAIYADLDGLSICEAGLGESGSSGAPRRHWTQRAAAFDQHASTCNMPLLLSCVVQGSTTELNFDAYSRCPMPIRLPSDVMFHRWFAKASYT